MPGFDPVSFLVPLLGQVLKKNNHDSDSDTHSDVTAVAHYADAELAAVRAQLAAMTAERDHWKSLAEAMLRSRGLLPPR